MPTFAALQGKQLHFEGDQRPFKRCLAFQASQSRHSALCQGRISPSDVPEINGSAWSQSNYLERIKVSSVWALSHICIMNNAKRLVVLHCVGLFGWSWVSISIWAYGPFGQHIRGGLNEWLKTCIAHSVRLDSSFVFAWLSVIVMQLWQAMRTCVPKANPTELDLIRNNLLCESSRAHRVACYIEQ